MFCDERIPGDKKSVTGFLAKNFYHTKRVRNTILFCAVALSIIAITTVFGIPFGKIRAEEIRLMREEGTAASGRVENATEEQYQKLRKLSYICQVEKSVFVGEAASSKEGDREKVCQIVWVDRQGWDQLMKPAYTHVTGSYPKRADEILLSEKTLKKLGISKPRVGMEIDLDVSVGLFRQEKETFKLRGWYRDSCHELPMGYVSKDRVENWGWQKDRYTLLFKQSDTLGKKKAEEKLYRALSVEDGDQKIIVRDTAGYTAVSKLMGGKEMVVLGTLSILCGVFFLVRNVLWISMNEDVQSLGLLHTIGATKKQVKKIYRKQIGGVLARGSLLGAAVSIPVLTLLVPEMVGIHFLKEMGGRTVLYFFRPEILLFALVFVNGTLWLAAEGIIRKTVTMSCVASSTYVGNPSMKKSERAGLLAPKCKEEGELDPSVLKYEKAGRSVPLPLKRKGTGELWYLAWKNVTSYKSGFVITSLSLFLGILSFLVTCVIIGGSDYRHVIGNRPDFLLAGEFGDYGKKQGYGEEYKTREVDEDPLLTKGSVMDLLADNAYDEFSPVSKDVKESIQRLKGVDMKKSKVIEGAYLHTFISKRGIRPYLNDTPDTDEGGMVEGFTWDTVQILGQEEIEAIKKYVKKNGLPVDTESLENGRGVLIVHDHMLSPKQQTFAGEVVGEPVYFETLVSGEEAAKRKKQKDSGREEDLKEEELSRKSSETFALCGYLDRQGEGFPQIHQSWHGAEGSLYFLISAKGFEKIPTEKKTLGMEISVQPEKESYIKTKLQEIVSEENRSRSRMENTFMDESKGEAGIFLICKSDLIQQKEAYMQGNRILLGSVSLILLMAGLTNYFNVVFTGMYARRKEFDTMHSLGMTDRQMKRMLYGECGVYFLFIMGMLCTVGTGVLFGVKVYMEHRLPCFVFSYPLSIMAAIGLLFLCINGVAVHFIWKRRIRHI